jgi:hypothetical protein
MQHRNLRLDVNQRLVKNVDQTNVLSSTIRTLLVQGHVKIPYFLFVWYHGPNNYKDTKP